MLNESVAIYTRRSQKPMLGRGLPRVLISGLIATLAFATTSLAENDDDDTVIVEQRFPADYTRVDVPPETKFSGALGTTVRTIRNDTLSKIISNHYGVGKSNAGAMYNFLEQKIIQDNNLAGPDALPENQDLVIPDLPPLAKTRPNPLKPGNLIPKLSVDRRILEPGRLTSLSIPRANDLLLSDVGRVGSQIVASIRAIKARDAKRLLQTNPNSLSVLSAPIPVTFAAAPQNATTTLLSNSEQTLLQAKLSLPVQKHPVLVILDDQWPDDGSFIDARNFFVDAIQRVRQRYGLPPHTFSKTLLSAKQLQPTAGANNQPSGHAIMVKRAIAPLAALAPQQLVRVIFVPLFTAQNGASEILEQLIEINQIAEHMSSNWGHQPVDGDIIKTDSQLSTRITASLAALASGQIPKSDKAVVESVLWFFRFYSQIDTEPYIVNLSWTTPNFFFRIDIPEDGYGLLVAAAGNAGDDNHTTVYDVQDQLVARSRDPGDVLGVMNVDADGMPACKSSLLEVTPLIYGVSFPGTIGPDECGTSFSAPRVAWLIAAREAVTAAPMAKDDFAKQYQRAAGLWRTGLKQQIRDMQSTTAVGYNRIKFDIEKFFSAIPPNTGG